MGTSFTVEVAFGYLPFDAPSWTDISHFVQRFASSRGRQHELSRFEPGTLDMELHDFGTGCFDPSYTSGTFYPNITLGTRVRVSATGDLWGPEEVFDGYINSWQPSVAGPNFQIVSVSAADLARGIGRGNMHSPLYANRVSLGLTSASGSTVAWYRCDDASGTVATDSSGNALDGEYATFTTGVEYQQASALTFDPNPSIGTANGRLIVDTSAQAPSLSSAGWFQTSDAGFGVIVDRRPPGDPDPTVQLSVFGGALVLNVQGVTTTVIASGMDDGTWHMVGLGNWTGDGYVYVDGASYGPYTVFARRTGDHTTIGAEVGAGGNNLHGLVDEWMIFNADLDPGNMIGPFSYWAYGQPLYSLSTPGAVIEGVLTYGVGWTGASDITAGHVVLDPPSGTLSGQSALSYIQKVETTEGPDLAIWPANHTNRAAFFVSRDGTPTFVAGERSTSGPTYRGTFGPDVPGGDIPWRAGAQWAMDDLNLYAQVEGRREGGPLLSASVAGVNILKYGLPASLALETLLYTTDFQVRERLAYELEWLRVPRVRLPTIVVQSSQVDDASAETMATLELADFCSVADPQGRYTVAVAEVERVEHNVDMNTGAWETTLAISPAYEV